MAPQRPIRIALSYDFFAPVSSEALELKQLCNDHGRVLLKIDPTWKGDSLARYIAHRIRSKLRVYVASSENTKNHELKYFRFYVALRPTADGVEREHAVSPSSSLVKWFSATSDKPMEVTAVVYYSETPSRLFTLHPVMGAEFSVLNIGAQPGGTQRLGAGEDQRMEPEHGEAESVATNVDVEHGNEEGRNAGAEAGKHRVEDGHTGAMPNVESGNTDASSQARTQDRPATTAEITTRAQNSEEK